MPEIQEHASDGSPKRGRGGLLAQLGRLLPRNRPVRWMTLALVGLILGSSLAVALERYFTAHIARHGSEQSLVFQLDAPYGSVNLLAGSNPNDVATIETLSEDAAAHNCQWSYGIREGNVGILRIGIGTDGEGMIASPPIALSYANSGFSLASAPEPESDCGSRRHIVPFCSSMPPLPGTFSYSYGYIYRMRPRSISTDQGIGWFRPRRPEPKSTLQKVCRSIFPPISDSAHRSSI